MSEQFDTPEERAFAEFLRIVFDVNEIPQETRLEIVNRFVAHKHAASARVRVETIEECAAIADDKWGDPIIADAIRALNEVQP